MEAPTSSTLLIFCPSVANLTDREVEAAAAFLNEHEHNPCRLPQGGAQIQGGRRKFG